MQYQPNGTTSTTYRIQPGQRLTDYTTIDVTVQRIDGGGMGIVAFGPCAIHGGRMIALKTIRPDLLAKSARIHDRFTREALTWVGLWPHANILLAQTVTIIDGIPFLVLDYAEHGSLRHVLANIRPHLPLGTSLSIAQHIATGLVVLHTPDPQFLRSDPIVHRDLKPENLLLRQIGDGQFVQITDFGLAKTVHESGIELALSTGALASPTHSCAYRTQRGFALGTPAYMPPEQWQDAGNVDTPADLYAFGQILSELVTGQFGLAPTYQNDTEAWRQAHLQQTPCPLHTIVSNVPANLETLYQALLSKKPEQRPTAAQTLAALQQLAVEVAEQPYFPPEISPHTTKNERIRWHTWSVACSRLGLNSEARQRLGLALALDEGHPDVLIAQANVLAELGEVDTALAIYAQVLSATPEHEIHQRKMIHNQIGILMSKIERYAEAETAYAQALELMPDAANTWVNRAHNEGQWAEVEALAGRIAEAQQHVNRGIIYAERAKQLAPNHQNNQRILAMLYQQREVLDGQ